MKKIKKITNAVGVPLLTLTLIFAVLIGAFNYIIPDTLSIINGDSLPSFSVASPDTNAVTVSAMSGGSNAETYTVRYKLFGLIPIKSVSVNAKERASLYVGGFPFGVRFSTDGLLVIGYGNELPKSQNPAYAAGIRPSDIINEVNGKTVTSAETLLKASEESNGNELVLSCVRNGKSFTARVKPYYSKNDKKYKTGITVRDSVAGIGTVTFVDPETNQFGGLGHGICDGDTSCLLPLKRGAVTDVKISGVEKGVVGNPGELRGSFGLKKTGSLLKNTSCGVFGMFAEKPSECGELLPVGVPSELKTGDAYIYCTLDGGTTQKYSIKITDIDYTETDSKCFSIKVTDRALIDKTGGIVQGMSGSPIIQNGKLVGAVTHVLINDPTTGYGIFIENMLNAAQTPMAKAS